MTAKGITLERDPLRLNRSAPLIFFLRMIFSENRFPSPIKVEDILFGIMR